MERSRGCRASRPVHGLSTALGGRVRSISGHSLDSKPSRHSTSSLSGKATSNRRRCSPTDRRHLSLASDRRHGRPCCPHQTPLAFQLHPPPPSTVLLHPLRPLTSSIRHSLNPAGLGRIASMNVPAASRSAVSSSSFTAEQSTTGGIPTLPPPSTLGHACRGCLYSTGQARDASRRFDLKSGSVSFT
jgi:hypothetical protein